MNTAPIRTILVVRSSAMGDVAMAVPVLKAFEQNYGKVRVIMLTNARFKPMFDPILNVAVYPIDLNGKHKGVRGIFKLYKELKAKYEIDAIIDLHDKLYSKLLCKLFKLSKTYSFKIDKGREQKKELTAQNHKQLVQLRQTVDRYADVFEKASYPIRMNAKAIPEKETVPSAVKNVFPENQFAIAIAPFASFEGKTMPLQLLNDTVKLITEKYPTLVIFLLGGSLEEKLITENLQDKYPNCISLVRKVSLKDEMRLIANLKTVISMDSGAMHLASIVGTPVVSIFGATHPFAGFLGYNQSLDDVVQLNMACRPCSVYGNKECLFKHLNCLNNITADMIVSKLDKYLNDNQ